MPSLILTPQSNTVNVSSKHIVVSYRNEENNVKSYNVPLFDIDRIIISGSPNISVPTLKRLCKHQIPVFLTSSKGKFIGYLTSPNAPNAARKILQYKTSLETQKNVQAAKKIIYAKIFNSRRVIIRLAANRSLSDSQEIIQVTEKLKYLRNSVFKANDFDTIRGIEGLSAAIYFSTISQFFPAELPFVERSRQPPKNEINSLLSFTYAIIQGEINSAILLHSLDPNIGFLHAISHSTPSLALDLIEPLRSCCADLFVLYLVNHSIITKKDFYQNSDDNGTYLKPTIHKTFFQHYEQHMTRKFIPKKGEIHTDFRQVIDKQVCQYLKFLADEQEYQFFHMP